MHLEVIRAITDWLSGATKDYAAVDQGVNAQLVGIPYDGSDTAPSNVAFFGDVTRSDAVAANAIPVNSPAVYVSAASPAVVDGEVRPGPPGVRDARGLGVAIRYIRRDANTANAFRDTGYTLRAIVRSLKQFCRAENAAARLRNSIQLRNEESLTWGMASEWEGNVAVTGALITTWYVRDNAP